MIKKYYQPFPTGDSKSGGYLILDEAGDVNNPESLVMTLVNGNYRPYEILNIGTCICEEWKNTIEEFIDKDSGINFIPVQTISKEYGNRTYYLGSERRIRKLKVKQKISGCFRSDTGADAFHALHSIADTAWKNGISPLDAILALA